MSLIYKITNPKNEVYIGSTSRSLSARKAEHKYKNKIDRNGLLYDSFKYYGFDNHSFEIVCTVSEDRRIEVEHIIIRGLNAVLNIVKNYNETAIGKIWVNDSINEFQILPSEFNSSMTRGRLYDIAALGRSNLGRKRIKNEV